MPISKLQQIRTVLLERICAGHYRDCLPNQAELAQELGVSRVTLREAIAHLTAWGVIETGRGQPARVIKPAAWPVLNEELLQLQIQAKYPHLSTQAPGLAVSQLRAEVQNADGQLDQARRTRTDLKPILPI